MKIKKDKIEDKNGKIENKSNTIENKSENIEIKIDVNKKKVIEKEKFSRTKDWMNTTSENLFYLDNSTINSRRIETQSQPDIEHTYLTFERKLKNNK